MAGFKGRTPVGVLGWSPQKLTTCIKNNAWILCLLLFTRLSSYGGGLFLGPALRYGTGYQTVWETRPSAETPSDVHWRRFYFQITCVHSALELSGRCALQIYLLTYLLTYLLGLQTTSTAHKNTLQHFQGGQVPPTPCPCLRVPMCMIITRQYNYVYS